MTEVRSQKSEVRSQKSEVRIAISDWRLAIGGEKEAATLLRAALFHASIRTSM